jgi:predicted nucleic acid-binding protein
MTYVLDACALIAVCNGEAGAEKVRTLLLAATGGESNVYISPVTLLEVYYDRVKVEGREKADVILRRIYSSAIEILETIPAPLIREAGRFKAAFDMSLADTFVCATASWLSATLVTADGELKLVEAAEPINFFWFRPPKPKKDNAPGRTLAEAERELAAAQRRIAELEAR